MYAHTRARSISNLQLRSGNLDAHELDRASSRLLVQVRHPGSRKKARPRSKTCPIEPARIGSRIRSQEISQRRELRARPCEVWPFHDPRDHSSGRSLGRQKLAGTAALTVG